MGSKSKPKKDSKISIFQETKHLIKYFFIGGFVFNLIFLIILMDFSELLQNVGFALFLTLAIMVAGYSLGTVLMLKFAYSTAISSKKEQSAYYVIFAPTILFLIGLIGIASTIQKIKEQPAAFFILSWGWLWQLICPINNYFLFKKIIHKNNINFAKDV